MSSELYNNFSRRKNKNKQIDDWIQLKIKIIRNVSFNDYRKKVIKSFTLKKRVEASRKINGGGVEDDWYIVKDRYKKTCQARR